MQYTARYNFSRRVNTVIQRYQLRRRLRQITNLLFFLFIVWFIGGTLTILSQWIISPGAQDSARDYLQYYWIVFIEVTSGFDVGDEVNRLNQLSFIITIVMLIAGMIIGGLVSGQIIAIILNAAQKAGFVAEAPNNFKFIDPIIIFGINRHLHGIISSIRKIDGNANRDIIIIDEKADEVSILSESNYKNIWYIKSNPLMKNYLKEIFDRNISPAFKKSDINKLFKASQKSCRVILLPNLQKDHNIDFLDPETIQKAMEIETFKENIYTIIQLQSAKSKRYLKNKHLDEWLNISDYSTKMIAQAALRPGLTNVFNNIMGGGNDDGTNEMIRLSLIHDSLSNLSFRDIKNRIVKDSDIDCILLGFCKFLKEEDKGLETLRNPNYYFQINPVNHHRQKYFQDTYKSMSVKFNKDTILNDGHKNDLLVYFADKNIAFDQYIIRR